MEAEDVVVEWHGISFWSSWGLYKIGRVENGVCRFSGGLLDQALIQTYIIRKGESYVYNYERVCLDTIEFTSV